MKHKPASPRRSSDMTSGRRWARSHSSKNRLTPLFIISFVLLSSVFIMKRSIAQYRQEQNQRELELTVEESFRSEGKFQPDQQAAVFLNEPVNPLAQAFPEPERGEPFRVLGETSGEKWIDIDLSTQTLRAMEGDKPVYEFLISSGKWAPTPTGEFAIWSKFRYTKMSGGSKELNTYYYLPNVPYVMYFHDGFGIHGAYWHNNFGHPMSHGCVNMSIADAEKIFYWSTPNIPEGQSMARSSSSNPGTKVVVHGKAPLN